MTYIVTAAYVTLRAKDDLGSEVLKGFYRGAPLPDDVNDDDLQKHIRKGMVAEKGSPEAEGVDPVGERVEFDEHGGPKPASAPAAAKPTPKPPAAKPAQVGKA